MSLRRITIRNKIKDILKGKTLAGNNVFSNLSSASWREELPAIVVYSRAETVEEVATSPREYKRTLELSIELMAEGPEDPNTEDGPLLEDILDTMAEQVELELNRDETLGDFGTQLDPVSQKRCAIVDELLLNSVEFEYVDGDKPTGSAKLIFNVVYYEYRPGNIDEQPGVSDFKIANAKWDTRQEGAPVDVDEAEDTISLPQS